QAVGGGARSRSAGAGDALDAGAAARLRLGARGLLALQPTGRREPEGPASARGHHPGPHRARLSDRQQQGRGLLAAVEPAAGRAAGGADRERAAVSIEHAEVVLPGAALGETLAFFDQRLGFRIEAIFPADSPAVALLSGHGDRVRLERDSVGAPGTLRLACAEPAAIADGRLELEAPDGTRVLLVPATPELSLPPLQASLVITRTDEDSW